MPDGHENAEVEKKIYRAITEISNGRLFPEKNGLLWNGILELDVSFVRRRHDSVNIISGLSYIINTMPGIMLGKTR